MTVTDAPEVQIAPIPRRYRERFWAEMRPALTPSVKASAAFRVGVTRNSPLRFAMVYLQDTVTLRERTPHVVSFSELHLEMLRKARRWRTAGELREAWVAPRGAGKSVFLFKILPLWALAHRHRNFFLGMSWNEKQAEKHLANLRLELSENEKLRRDFPHLIPQRRPGARNTATMVTGDGVSYASLGLGETANGLRAGNDRPDLMLVDDPEPMDSDYSIERKEKLLRKLLDGVLPMGQSNTILQMAGTITMQGSAMHELVRHARGEQIYEWVDDYRIVPYVFPGIMVDPETGVERSLWPARWKLTGTHLGTEKRGTRGFAMNYTLDPRASDASEGWWTEDLLRRPPSTYRPEKFVAYIDVAVSVGDKSDHTAIVVLGLDVSERYAVVEYARSGLWTPEQTRQHVHRLLRREEKLREVRVEKNNGGITWEAALNPPSHPLPRGVRLTLEHVGGASKKMRAEVALSLYERGKVFHAYEFPQLDASLLGFPSPRVKDDPVDAVAGALRWAFPRG